MFEMLAIAARCKEIICTASLALNGQGAQLRGIVRTREAARGSFRRYPAPPISFCNSTESTVSVAGFSTRASWFPSSGAGGSLASQHRVAGRAARALRLSILGVQNEQESKAG